MFFLFLNFFGFNFLMTFFVIAHLFRLPLQGRHGGLHAPFWPANQIFYAFAETILLFKLLLLLMMMLLSMFLLLFVSRLFIFQLLKMLFIFFLCW